MGWRALRLALDRDGLMKAQARALLEAAAGRELQVMFPMVSEPWEFDAAKALVEEQRAWLAERKKPLPKTILYGAMLEVPSLAEMLDVLLPRLDFLSIGTNDLTQFLFAADRSNPRLAERYDWLSPAILRFLKRIARACDKHQVPLGRLRRDGRADAGGDGADRHRHPPAVDHPGRGRPGQGDDPLAGRQGLRAPRSTGCCSTPPADFRGRARRLGGQERRVDQLGLVAAARRFARPRRLTGDGRVRRDRMQ